MSEDQAKAQWLADREAAAAFWARDAPAPEQQPEATRDAAPAVRSAAWVAKDAIGKRSLRGMTCRGGEGFAGRGVLRQDAGLSPPVGPLPCREPRLGQPQDKTRQDKTRNHTTLPPTMGPYVACVEVEARASLALPSRPAQF